MNQPKLGQRVNYCVFCFVPVQKIIRHLERFHKEEPDVQKFMAMPKQSQARKSMTTKLRLKGNHLHNVAAIKKKDGPIVVARRMGESTNSEVITCPNCMGYYAKRSLYRHRCQVVVNSKAGPVRKPGTVKQGKQFLLMSLKGYSTEASDIFAAMKVDDIYEAVKTDDLASELLELQLQKGEGEKQQWKKQIRYKLRLLGRFILEARKLLPGCHSLREILKCSNFLSIVEAAKECGKEELEKQESSRGAGGLTVPVKVGFLVKGCAEVLMTSAQREKDHERAKDAKHLLENYKREWGTR
jgi:hypothetical protein